MNDNTAALARGYHNMKKAGTQEELAHESAEWFLLALESLDARLDARQKSLETRLETKVESLETRLKGELHKELRTQTFWVAGITIALAIGLAGLILAS